MDIINLVYPSNTNIRNAFVNHCNIIGYCCYNDNYMLLLSFALIILNLGSVQFAIHLLIFPTI